MIRVCVCVCVCVFGTMICLQQLRPWPPMLPSPLLQQAAPRPPRPFRLSITSFPICNHTTQLCAFGIRSGCAMESFFVNVKEFCNPRLLNEYGDLFRAFVPVAIAVVACHSLKMQVAKDMRNAVIRSTLQLIGLGFVLKIVFQGERILISALAVSVMILIAGHTAGERAKELPNSHLVATLSLGIGTVGTLGLMLLLKAFPIRPRYIIPTAGYVVGSSMSMVGGTLNRLHHDIHLHRGQIEAALALGASPQQTVQHHIRNAVTQAMGPWIDSIKTAGLITLPGSMTGMLIGGFPPMQAVQMQVQVLYMLLGASFLSSAMSCCFGWHMLFTRCYQLRLMDPVK